MDSLNHLNENWSSSSSSTLPNVCDKIKSTCRYVYKNSQYVTVDDNKIEEFLNQEKIVKLFNNVPSWASCHFNPNDFDFELTLAFVFVVDSLNFCFWPYEELKLEKEFEYNNLVTNTLNTLKTNPDFFLAKNLMNLKVEDLCLNIFENIRLFPLLDERTRSLNELGNYIFKNYNSSFTQFLQSTNYDCVEIVHKISEGVTTYRDETIYKGIQISIFKRAQILAADLFYMCRELASPITLKNAESLTMFADYRVPQILLELNIMNYDSNLLNTVIQKEEMLPNTLQEVEIRANTIISVEKIKEYFNKKFDKNIFALEVDYVLWNIGEEKRKDLKPHHRTLTIFY